MYGIAGLLTGRTLVGRYLIEAVIGRGGMGAVYRAVDERLSRPVAVKVIGTSTTEEAEHARLRARFHREARAAAALHHPNVVAVHDFGTDPQLELDFLVMELLEGEDLSARLVRSGPPPLAAALSILRQAARGLAAGHRRGMVHRDVKPGNLFLEPGDRADAPRVRVLDFGIAQLEAEEGTMTHLTEYGRSPHSPAYASPEQLRGDERITPASDVFSLAAVAHHMLTGERAFRSADPAAMALEVDAAVRALRERVPALDDATFAVLERAFARTPSERFRDAGEMVEALEGEAGAAPTVRPAAAPAGANEDATRFQTIRPARTASSASVTPAAAPRRVAVAAPALPPPAVSEATVVTKPRGPALFGGPSPEPAPQPRPAPVAGAPLVAPPPRRPGRVRRFFRALWDFTVTTVSLALFVGAWGLAIQGVAEEDPRRIWLGMAAAVVFTPLAVHRLTGRRGRYGFGVLGSILATGGALYSVGRDADPAIGLAAVFGLQILACFAMSWLTRRTPREEPYPTV